MLAILAVLFALAVGAAPPAWPQWGGPSRNFVVDAPPLATAWPADGPRRLWERTLGDGYSAIVSDGTTLYTLYRSGDDDVAIAVDAATGQTAWETKYAAPFRETCSQRLGPVPRAAPLIDGDRLVTVSAGALMNSFDRRTGARIWQYDLLAGAPPEAHRPCGYSASPLAFRNLIITTAGGDGRGVVALDAASGKVAWQTQDFRNGHSSPILIDLDGRPELVVFTYGEVAGLDPATGALDWVRPHPSEFGVNVATPIWSPQDHLLFVSSAYNGGSRVLRLARTASGVTAEEVWSNKRVRVHFGNAVRLGKFVYLSNGDFGSAPFAAVDITTGEMPWRDRAVSRATLIGAGGKLIILDEDGNLAIATPSNAGLNIHAKAQVLKGTSWTIPTLVGSKLYLRNTTQMLALELAS